MQEHRARRDAGSEQARARRERPEARVAEHGPADRRTECYGKQLVECAENRHRQPAEREEMRHARDMRREVIARRELRRDPHETHGAGEQIQRRGGEVLAGESDRTGRR